MTKKEILVTEEGLKKLQDELKDLVEVRRPEIVGRIKNAKELGDLSENAEYVSAKEEQSFIEGRIQELEQSIKYAKLVDNKKSGTVNIGTDVEVEVDADKFSLVIVGGTESDPAKGKISVESPVAQALLGHKAGDKVSVETPDGAISYRIISIK
jgi:transcription elongation factor GreA